MNPLLTQPQEFTPDKQDKLEWDFETVLMHNNTIKEMWLALSQFFIPFDSVKQERFYGNYWKWFVILTWSNLQVIPKGMFVQIIIPQLPLAFILFDNVEEKVLSYLYWIPKTDEDRQVLFDALAPALKQSTAYINPVQKNKNILSQVSRNILREYAIDEDILARSALYGRLKNMYITKEHASILAKEEFFLDSADRFIKFILFIGNKRNIPNILENFMVSSSDWLYNLGNQTDENIIVLKEETFSKLKKENPTSVKSPQPVSTTVASAKPAPLKKQKPVIVPKPLNFLEKLAKQKDILSWLATPQIQKEFISWASTQDKARAKEIIALGIKRQIPTLKESTAQQILELDAWLQAKGYTHKDLILFNEETFSFEWNI
jgi:hypothetical protein